MMALSHDDALTSYEGSEMAFGIDYSAARFSGAELKSKGVTFVCRYLRNSASGIIDKALTKAEADDIRSAGITLVSNDETTGKSVLGGFSQGVSDARGANAAHLACGGSSTAPIYFSPWDHDTLNWNDADWNLLWAYLDGCASVLGRDRIGFYQGYDAIKKAFDLGKIKFGWQTFAWSEGRWDSRAHIQQYNNGEWGGQVDFNRSMKLNFGQWGGEADTDMSYELWTDIGKAQFWADMNEKSTEPVIHYLDHGDTKDGSSNHHKAIITRLTSLATAVGAQADDETKIIQAINAAKLDPQVFLDAFMQALQNQQVSVTYDEERLKADFLSVLQNVSLKVTPNA